MSRKRLKKLIMSWGFGAYNAQILIDVYKRNGCYTNQQVLNVIREDLSYWE